MIRSIFVLMAIALLSGCISLKSYVDPSYAKATHADIKTAREKYNTKVNVEFQRNGKHLERGDKEIRGHVERALRATNVFNPTESNESITLKVVVNNVADMGQAAAKGFGTGLTFGLAGSAVTDYYEFTITYTDVWGMELAKSYKHALHSTVGNKAAPIKGVKATTPADGIATIIEQVVVNFVFDMQSKGLLGKYEGDTLFGHQMPYTEMPVLALDGMFAR